jgi:tRNA threonylcarbamoyladenosine biosynthesis protein TsaE
MNGLDFSISPACIIFLYWDLWAGKTTLSKEIISRYTLHNYVVTSPTYVYDNRYEEIYHFDLYRMRDYDEFVSIGWEEILDNNTGIVIIEWPEMLEQFYIPDIIIRLDRTEIEGIRKIEIIYKKNNTILPQHF